MTNIIKRKGLLFLMAVVVMIAMMSIACKNKATRPMDFSAEVVSEEQEANPSEVLTPDGQLAINKNAGADQYAGKYFESKTYINNDGTTFKYTIEIKNLSDGRSTVLIFSGYEDGKQFSKQYNFPGFIKGRGDSYYNFNEGGSGVLNDGISPSATAKVKFYNDENNKGWANLQPAKYNFTIKLALKNK